MTALDNPLDNPGVTYAMTVAVDEAVAERVRQDARWGREFPGRPHSHWLAILTEEVGEAAEAVCQTEIPSPEQDQKTRADLYREVVQVAAVALSWLEHGEWGQA